MALLIIVLVYLCAIMSIVLHEYAHGYAAYVCGDDTAYLLGRLTLNPIAHIDLFMTILLPLFTLFTMGFALGGAKPVPINPYRFRHMTKGYRFVSVAGVAVNLMLASSCAFLIHLLRLSPTDAGGVLIGMVCFINLILALFNLIPIPPLDGSRILRTYLPPHLRDAFDRMDRWGLLILVALLYAGIFRIVLLPLLFFVWENVFLLGKFSLFDLLTSFRQCWKSAF